jgi:hypothetical protein
MKRISPMNSPNARTLPFGPTTLAIAVVALALVATPARAGAQQLSACYVPKSGTVYMINQAGTPTSCLSRQHVEFSWSTTGAQGPQGPEGPQGPQGPQGPAGPLSGLEFHSEAATLTPSGTANYGIFFATCSAPTKSVMNFGYQPGSGGVIFASRPAVSGAQVVWAFQAEANSTWTFYWTCVDGVRAVP